MNLECEPINKHYEISTSGEVHNENDKLFTNEPNEEVTIHNKEVIHEDKTNTCSFDFIDCPIIDL